MTDKTPPAPPPDQAGDLRGQLVKRLAVAGVLVAVLLGMLAFFDYLARAPQDEADEGPVFSQPVPVAPKKDVSQPVKPATDLPAPPVAEPTPAAPVGETPTAPPAPPQAPAVPSVADETKPEVRPAPRTENRPPSRSTAAVARAAPPSAPPVAEETASPAMAPRQETAPPVAARPSARVVEPAPATSAPQPALTRLLSGFLLQAGVFSSPKSAEELHARLTLSGVPSTLETRVQVGPFRTRQEAEAAQQKLKALGVETILVPPSGAKR